ncbi:molybdopterin-binding protein [Paraburkholderia unamae]|uniref:Molybdopterin-binding protein n=1 Tax=Paraburkholderia unamae TaxID=219649 RepID=A0ACC6RVS7_9BURK
MEIATAPVPIDHTAGQSAPLQLTGSLVRPLSLLLEALRQYPAVTGPAFDLRCYTTQRFIRAVAPYRGVRLTDLLAYECGDKALDAQHGAPVLFSGADLVPAPRHVKRLARIEARVLAR